MAQPPPWKAMYLDVATHARDGCLSVRESVDAAHGVLASPLVLDTRDAEGRYTLLESAVTHIEQASNSLSDFIVYVVVAERLTLHGCDAERLGLSRLQAAREHAEDALRRLEGAFTHLGSVRYMLLSQNPDAPGRRQAMEGQLHALDLQPVVVGVASMSALASLALEPPIGNRIQ